MERNIYPAKHIEIQILADQHGNVVHLGERDCSLNVKNQKIIEEAPSPSHLSPQLRRRNGGSQLFVLLKQAYQTQERLSFLWMKKNIYFMEMNTRIQVEHPITEMITNVDLVQQQIKIAAGEEGLPFTLRGYYLLKVQIECRCKLLKNPFEGFRPSPGKVTFLHQPVGGMACVIESALCIQDIRNSPILHDSMLTKLIGAR